VDRPVSQAISFRRSVRRFTAQPVDPALIDEIIALACLAPAPHHSRPWRFVNVATEDAREAVADAMSDSWRADLEAEGRTVHEIASLLEKSRLQVTDPPVVLLACITLDEARPWPDERRRAAERDMFVQSLGAALQNILLAAEERGLAGYLKGAPLFCADALKEALSLPTGWEPTFLVLLGHPHPEFLPSRRAEILTSEFLVER
jgi:coenzyme F420-0:L-glutamate ligase/coenzyme F420-1:gamma-L-glutamate ligase